MGRAQRDRNGRWKECRCKTVTFKSEPTLAELTEQLRAIAKALPALVHHDGDVDWEVEKGDLQMSRPSGA